jgi:hypothetical protein
MMRTPSAILALLPAALLASGLAGCKTKEVTRPDPETAQQLTECKQKLDDKDKYIAKLLEENTRQQMQRGGEIVVKIEGGNMTVRAGQPGGTLAIDERAAAAGAQAFIDVVEKSRGSIQKCYEHALKKSSGLHNREVNLTVYATFTPQGAVASSYSAPPLGEPFDGCIKQVTQKWTVKGSSSSMTYQQVVKLKPS